MMIDFILNYFAYIKNALNGSKLSILFDENRHITLRMIAFKGFQLLLNVF